MFSSFGLIFLALLQPYLFKYFKYNYFSMALRRRRVPDGRIEKPEDRDWQQWYETLPAEEHEKLLGQLGLDKEDIAEWESQGGVKKLLLKKGSQPQ